MSKLKLNSKFIKTASALMSGKMFYTAISFIIVLVQSRFVGPDVLGTIDYFTIPIGYLWILTLGIPSALAREIPYLISTGNRDKACAYVRTAETFSVFMGGLCSAAFLILAIKNLICGNYLYAMGWAFQIVNSFINIYSNFLITTYRTTDEFIKIARSNYISGIFTVLFFPLVFVNPYFGLMTKNNISPVFSNLYLFKKRPFKGGFEFDRDIFKSLIKFGFPLIIIGYIEANLWTSLQKTIITSAGGTELLGIYGFVNRILTAGLIIPNAVNDILRPKYVSNYANNDENTIKTVKSVLPTLAVSTAVSLVAALAGMLVLPYFINTMLPKYSVAVPALNCALIIMPITAFSTIKYIFVVCKNLKINFISTIGGFIVSAILQFFLLKTDRAVETLFLPYAVGKMFNIVISLILIFILGYKERRKRIEQQ